LDGLSDRKAIYKKQLGDARVKPPELKKLRRMRSAGAMKSGDYTVESTPEEHLTKLSNDNERLNSRIEVEEFQQKTLEHMIKKCTEGNRGANRKIVKLRDVVGAISKNIQDMSRKSSMGSQHVK
jgi:septal ring factor EnvC (AmiA/AmiB activator)